MSADALDWCLTLHRAHASLNLKLDDELGTLHGIGLDEFVLLSLLADAQQQRLQVSELVRPMGASRSCVVRRVIAMEKTGLVERRNDEREPGRRHVVLRPAGQQLWRHARITAQAVCAQAVGGVAGSVLAQAGAVLAGLATTEALQVS